MFEKNEKQVNCVIANIMAACTVIVLIMTLLSVTGFFAYGRLYTCIVLIAGMLVCILPKLLIEYLPDRVMKYYMLISVAAFIGVIGTNNYVSISITYILVPLLSCLYFEPKLVLKSALFSYVIMLGSVYISSSNMVEVARLGRPRLRIFGVYALAFSIEYVVVAPILYFLVKRAKGLMEEHYTAEQKNQVKTIFLSNVSHEIRTPMNAIIGLSEMSLHKTMDEELRKNITSIHTSASELLGLLNDILDFSRIEAGRLEILNEPYNTARLVDDMETMIDARNDGEVPIYYHISDDMPKTLDGDLTRIKQVMLNFATNAIQYTSEGQIDITLRCEAYAGNLVNLIFVVSDTGQGIRKEDMDKLFTVYGRLMQKEKKNTEGSGIGLAISKSFITQMGGSINAQSEYGKGSTFSFTLPQKISTDYVCEKIESDEVFHAGEAKILVVDDNEINRDVAKVMLQPLGVQVEEAVNGRDAVSMVLNKNYDVILMDSRMPVMCGEDATKAIRDLEKGTSRHTAIVALTADAMDHVRERLLGSGMDDCIIKPMDSATLYRTLRKYIPKDKIEDKKRVPLQM